MLNDKRGQETSPNFTPNPLSLHRDFLGAISEGLPAFPHATPLSILPIE